MTALSLHDTLHDVMLHHSSIVEATLHWMLYDLILHYH